MAGEKPAARLTDMHTCPMVTGVVPHVGGPILPPCAPTVLIGGLPAARLGDLTARPWAVANTGPFGGAIANDARPAAAAES